ncbi:MAG: rod shape-determining protein MreD [Olsenella sp.]|jgi:rod shape-determining protein MreD
MQNKDANRSRYGNIALAALCFVLQLALAPNLSLGSGRLNFAVIFAFCISLLVGGRRGVVYSFFAGLVFDLSTTGPVGLMALLLTVTSYVLGLEERNRFSDGSAACLSSFAISSFAVIFLYHLAMLGMGQAESLFDALLMRTLPSYALTFVAYLFFNHHFTKDAAGGVSARPRRGSHYSVKGL